MERTFILPFFIIIIELAGCGQTKKHFQKPSKNALMPDSSAFAILPYDTTQHWLFKGGQPTGLSSEDLAEIENILQLCISNHNLEQEKYFKEENKKHPEYKLNKNDFIIDLSKYKRQYVPVISSKGEKEVWVNFFCYTWDRNWRTDLLVVDDGGNCYFNVKINLTTGKYYELWVNGVA